ncbi:TonB-dependent receptor [Parabacteroides sp. AF17-28]|uniref:TonB-dependent receptor n=1 Tax=Parabacteroides sp. AF17-28 TaxID=2292241 RepID=UPI000EFEA65B|nr:TonB-dependent receptor [Parabacteroides sp. AF17-28]RHR58996.1 SusC/RagA family TonB-linked outer membrane protein [Parabacteroides sp. AF17-28]
MKLSLLLLCITFSVFARDANSQNAKVTLNKQNVAVHDILDAIEEQTEFLFLYNKQNVNVNRRTSIHVSDQTVSNVLSEIFKGTNISFKMEGKHIVLVHNQIKEDISDRIQQEGKTLNGIVKDKNGEPIIGANVVVKGTTNGTITDIDGQYSLSNVSNNDILTISYIGYLSKDIPVNGQQVINILLDEDTQKLDEIVVVGYGTVKKRDLTGSVASINAEKIEQIAVTNPALALQGRIPGVLVEQTDYAPGGGLKIRVRGNRSFKASNDPLYVVDGMPLTTGIEAINPSDIESIDVLKDASATAVYGARGANGVIIVTTKKGKAGKVQVDYNGYVGVQTVAKRLDVMDGAEWTEALREAYRATGLYQSPTPSAEEDAKMPRLAADPYSLESVLMAYDENGNYDPSKVRSFDWQGNTLHESLIHNHNLNIRGGSEKTQYSLSASYLYNDGVIKNRDYEKYTVRLNIDQEIGKILKVGLQTQYMHSNENKDIGIYVNAMNNYPVSSPYDDKGELILNPGGDAMLYNSLMDLDNAISLQKIDRYLGSYYAEVNIVDGLKFRTNLGTDFRQVQDLDFRGSMTTENKGGLSTAKNAGEKSYLFTLENMLTYSKKFNKTHDLGVTLLQSIQRFAQDKYGIEVKDLPYEYQHFFNVGSASTISGVSSDYLKWTLASFMGRVNYNIKDRYLFTVSARYDGSSRLAKGNKWVLFPSAAFAWRIFDEPFIPETSFLTNLKLRLGWGQTGNSAVDPYQTMGGLLLQKYNFGGTNAIGYYPNIMPNENLTWETTAQTNLGIDFGFFNNRLSGSIDLYLQRTKDLLMSRQLPVVSGYESVMANIGKTQNKGIEIALSSVNLESEKGLNWTTDLMVYANKEEIIELYNGKKDDIGNKWFIGQPIDVIYDYQFDRIWQDTPEDLAEMAKFNANGSSFVPGTIKLVDQNNDYKITADDKVIIGNSRPKLVVSLANNFSYKGFDLSVFLNGEFGKKITYDPPLNLNGRENYVNINYWTPSNPSNECPRPNANQTPQYISAIKYCNGTYLRVRDITLGYTLPDVLTKKAFIERLRFYASVQNPFLFTSFPGVDPEGARGKEYPSVRTFMFGANISF